MQSSAGTYRPGLDQIRGLASYLVFCWHFIHTDNVLHIAHGPVAMWPLSMISMGYIGVALFMTLSGYLFASLTLGREVQWGRFVRNRALRLLPLLSVVLVLAYLKSLYTGVDEQWGYRFAWGWLLPVLPQGAWSITVECHFYALLPVLLWLARRTRWVWLITIAAGLAVRTALYLNDHPDFTMFTSWTIIGRIDQFIAGMMLWQVRDGLRGRWPIAAMVLLAFSVFMRFIDQQGAPTEPSFRPDWLLLFLGTIEGFAFAVMIAWWDVNRGERPVVSRFGHFWVTCGRVSYSMYLLHTFWVFIIARWCHKTFGGLSSPELAMVWSTGFFVLSVPIAAVSYRLIELPFLRKRTGYEGATSPTQRLPGEAASTPKLKDAA